MQLELFVLCCSEYSDLIFTSPPSPFSFSVYQHLSTPTPPDPPLLKPASFNEIWEKITQQAVKGLFHIDLHQTSAASD